MFAASAKGRKRGERERSSYRPRVGFYPLFLYLVAAGSLVRPRGERPVPARAPKGSTKTPAALFMDRQLSPLRERMVRRLAPALRFSSRCPRTSLTRPRLRVRTSGQG